MESLRHLLTVLHYTSNRQSPRFEAAMRAKWLAQVTAQGLSLVTVAQQPIDVPGVLLVVGNRGASGFNMFRQIERGLEVITTPYVLAVEADCLYPPEYFTFIPPRQDTFYRVQNAYLLGWDQRAFWRKPANTWAQVVGTQHYLSRLRVLFDGAPPWSLDEFSFPKERHHCYDVTDRAEYYDTAIPCVSVKAKGGMRKYSASERLPVEELPYWGRADALVEELQPWVW